MQRRYARYFEDLQTKLGTDHCTACGACKGVCDTIHPDMEVLYFDNKRPNFKDRDLCTGCGTCIDICPQTTFDFNLTKTFEGSVKGDLGYLIEKPIAISASELNFPVQDGGIVSSIVVNALKKSYVDAAILTRRDEKWTPITEIVTDPEEVPKFAGSKYTTSSPMPKLLEAINNYKNVLFIGLPQQVKSARKIQLYNKLDLGGRHLKGIIGLFCTHSFNYDRLFNLLKVEPEQIEKMAMYYGNMVLIKKDGRIIQKSLEALNPAVNYYCQACNDFTAEYADISVGSVGSFKDSNTVFIRNKIGKELFELSMVSNK